MDKHFLEFWGNFMLNAAKSQKRVEEMSDWMRRGFTGFEEMASLFRKIYGLDRIAENSSDYLNMWKSAEAEFLNSFKEYMSLMGVVPKDEHLELIRKYEELKEKVASQEETIRHLRILLQEGKGKDYTEVTKQFENLVKDQANQFSTLMNGFGQMFKKDTPPEEKPE